jgi:hypothetical protein
MFKYDPRYDPGLKLGTALYWKTLPTIYDGEAPVTKFLLRPRNHPLESIGNLDQTPYMIALSIFGSSRHHKKDYWHFPYAVFLYPPNFRAEFEDWCTSISERNAYYANSYRNKIIWKGSGDEGGLISPTGIPTVRRELGESSMACADLLNTIESSTTIGSLLSVKNSDDDRFAGPINNWLYFEVVRSVTGSGPAVVESNESSHETIDSLATTPQTLQHLEVGRQIVGIDAKYQIKYRGTYPMANSECSCGAMQHRS